MKSLPALAAAVIFAAALPAAPTARWSQVDSVVGFGGWRQQLQHMVDQDGHTRVNHFCIVAASYKAHPPSESVVWAYVYWRENSQLYTFAQSLDDRMTDDAVFKSPLNLKTDVTQHPGSSTYRVTPGWIRHVLNRCASAGDQVEVERHV